MGGIKLRQGWSVETEVNFAGAGHHGAQRIEAVTNGLYLNPGWFFRLTLRLKHNRGIMAVY